MAINAMIPMGVQVADPLNALAKGYQMGNTIRQQPMMDKLNQQKLEAGKLAIDAEKVKMQELMRDSRIKAATWGALELSETPFEQWGNVLQRRIQEGGKYAYDAEAEKEALELLSRDPEALKSQVSGLVNMGRKTGLFGNRDIEERKLAQQDLNYRLQAARIQQDAAQGDRSLDLRAQQLASDAANRNLQQQLAVLQYQAAEEDRKLRQEQVKATTAKTQLETELKEKDAAKTAAKKAEFKNVAANLVRDLLSDENAIKNVVGGIDAWTPTILPSSLEAENRINTLKDVFTAENLDLLSGVLSDSDLMLLRNISAGNLSQYRDQDKFIQDLKVIQDKLSGAGVIEVDF